MICFTTHFCCRFCGQKFTRQGPFEKHEAKDHNVECDHCDLKFTNEVFLEEHLVNDHDIVSASPPHKKVKLEVECSKMGEARREVLRPPAPAPSCSKSVVDDIVTQHADKSTRDDKVLYTCRLCDNYQCSDRYQMRKHLTNLKHGLLISMVGKQHGKEVEKTKEGKEKEKLKEIKDKVKESKEKEKLKEGKEKEKVKEAGSSKDKSKQKVDKKVRAQPEDDTICEMCQEKFTTFEAFERHIEQEHTFQCPLTKTCDLSFVHE